MKGKKNAEFLKELRETYLAGLNDGLGKGFELDMNVRKKVNKGFEFA